MSRHLYQALLVLSPLSAAMAAVAGALGAFRLALVFLALCCAAAPVLLHLQTQRIVAISRTSESRVEKAIVRRLKGLPDLENSAEVNAIAAHLRKAVEDLKEDTNESTLSATANEFRRETRMTRLIMTELLDASRAGNPRGDQ